MDHQKDKDPVHPEAAVAPGFLVNHAAQVFNRLVDAALRPHGMSLALIGPIMLLSWKGPMLQRDMAHWSAVKQPALVALLDKLEGLGHIARVKMPNDRRAAMVSLTAQGQQMAVLGREALLSGNAVGIAGFSQDEAAMLVALLQRLVANFSEQDGTIYQK